ncbi:ABC transporter substrate-binding protein [Acinetobacter tianfuensis]|uniref:ABC transporter substrate-binding protein n=1 Tax=Acinetobacter tianfuensis TaxID=2419603 RepID=A0A3A8EMJ0_9GAMM|nr:ABC transporter substrate-binding protein [Acinetobacter tianfuensis]RKG31184.1 ABC transporter substrate-binding protein [Acinetobacter tianfuensis]
MNALEKNNIQLGYIPLLDCTAILWAHEKGYFAEQGLNVKLVKEPSWASLRDRLAFGILDAAHCLSAMLPAAATGGDHLGIPLQTSLVLSTTRAYISLSQKICFDTGITQALNPQESAHRIVQWIQDGAKVQLAHVFTQSLHHYCLREWLALADENIAKSYRLSSLPPPYMVEAVSAHLIDGFCVGEPWNIQAQIQGHSQIIAESRQIIPEIADKVLATTQVWAKEHPNTLQAIKEAIQRAQQEISNMQSLQPVWQMLEQYEIIRFSCSEQIYVEQFHKLQSIIRSFGCQLPPKLQDFIWIMRQMMKWEDLKLEEQQVAAFASQCIS